jgi:hypothetical protein
LRRTLLTQELSSALDIRGFSSGVLVKRVMKKTSSARLITPSTTNMLRQSPVRVCRPTATGAVSSAPRGAQQADRDHEASLLGGRPVSHALIDHRISRAFGKAEQNANGGETGHGRATHERKTKVTCKRGGDLKDRPGTTGNQPDTLGAKTVGQNATDQRPRM